MANMRQGFQNVELIDKTIASIKNTRRGFSMAAWDRCICGHMARAQGKDMFFEFMPAPVWGEAQLGISRRQASDLFTSNLDASREDAIRVLEILRDEGVVDWKRARDEVDTEIEESYRLMFEDGRLPFANTLDRLHDEFDRLVEKARALA